MIRSHLNSPIQTFINALQVVIHPFQFTKVLLKTPNVFSKVLSTLHNIQVGVRFAFIKTKAVVKLTNGVSWIWCKILDQKKTRVLPNFQVDFILKTPTWVGEKLLYAACKAHHLIYCMDLEKKTLKDTVKMTSRGKLPSMLTLTTKLALCFD